MTRGLLEWLKLMALTGVALGAATNAFWLALPCYGVGVWLSFYTIGRED